MTTTTRGDVGQQASARTAFVRVVRHETTRVAALILGLVALCALVTTTALPASPVSAPLHLPWYAFAVAFALTETVVMHLQVKREAQAVSISEFPLVLGFFFASPLQLLVGRVIGSVLVFVLHRKSSAVKTTFNAALVSAETLVGLAVFWAFTRIASGVGVDDWVGAYAGAMTANALGVVALSLVIAIYEGGFDVRDTLREAVLGQPVAPLVVTMALVAVNSLWLDLDSVYLLLAATGVLILGYRGYASLADRHLNLERLYHFSQAVSRSPKTEAVLQCVLTEAKDMLASDHAELVFPGPPGRGEEVRVSMDSTGHVMERQECAPDPDEQWIYEAVMRRGDSVVLPRNSKDASVRHWLASHGRRDAVVVPLHGDAGTVGMLFVGDRRGEVRTFTDDDVLLLETLGNHASIALQKGELIDRLKHDALHDALTGLPNRVAIHEELGRMLASAHGGRPDSGMATLILDLDGFKDVNDTLGHQQGDLVLIEVARRLVEAVSDDGVVGRLGGDEFCVLVPHVRDRGLPAEVSTRIIDSLRTPIALMDLRMEIGASVGIAIAPEDGVEATMLMKRADLAMYDAKGSGNAVCFFENKVDTGSARRLSMVTELREAIESGDLRVHLQPQADTATGTVVCFEALARWTHPELGAVSPDEFIAVAERSGLIRPLTLSVLDAGLAALAQMHDLDVTLAVNLSARCLVDQSLVIDVVDALARHGVAPASLVLEVTESAVMSDPTRAIGLLQQLHDLGVRLSVDDFGTGYSSLSYLKRLPVHEVKIDRSFIIGLTESSEDFAIVRSIVDLGRNLALDIVAEGVENETTWRLLADIGCTRIQGWYVATPMPVGDADAWLRQRVGATAAVA